MPIPHPLYSPDDTSSSDAAHLLPSHLGIDRREQSKDTSSQEVFLLASRHKMLDGSGNRGQPLST